MATVTIKVNIFDIWKEIEDEDLIYEVGRRCLERASFRRELLQSEDIQAILEEAYY